MSGWSPGKWLAAAAGLVMLAAVVGGLYVVGSPGEQRRQSLDQRRINDFIYLSGRLELAWVDGHALPSTLKDLTPGKIPLRQASDPETAAPYEYTALGGDRYRLCAIFAEQSPSGDAQSVPRMDEWVHPAGRTCFERCAQRRSNL